MKKLGKKDLKIGGYYVCDDGDYKGWIFKYTGNSHVHYMRSLYYSKSSWAFYEKSSTFIKATQQQREHLDACIAAGKYVDYEYTEEPKFEVGKWYKWYQENHGIYHYGKMHEFDDKEHFSMKPWICNCERYQLLGTFLTEKASKITLITDLSEIQKHLPGGHVDKFPVKDELTELPEKWCINLISQEIKDLVDNNSLCNIPIYNVRYGYVNYEKVYSCGKATDNVEITFDQLKKWVLKEEIKPVEKWSKGTYIVWTEEVITKCPKGTVDIIKKSVSSTGYFYTEMYGCVDSTREKEGQIKWFATKEEAEVFAKTLKVESKTEKQNDVKEIIPEEGKWYEVTAFRGTNYIVRYNDNWEDCEWIYLNEYSKSGSFSDVRVIRELQSNNSKITEPLLKYAKEKYPVRCKFKATNGRTHTLIKDDTTYKIIDGTYIHAHKYAGCLYDNGKWAEVVSLPEEKTDTYPTDVVYQQGDKVKIFRKATYHERGWDNSWISDMDEYVGKVCTVDRDGGIKGVSLDGAGHYCYPHFVLEKISDPKPTWYDKTLSGYSIVDWKNAAVKCVGKVDSTLEKKSSDLISFDDEPVVFSTPKKVSSINTRLLVIEE